MPGIYRARNLLRDLIEMPQVQKLKFFFQNTGSQLLRFLAQLPGYQLSHKRNTILIYTFVFFLGLLLFAGAKQEFVQPLSNSRFEVNVEFPSGTSFGVTDKTVQKVEKKLLRMPEIKEVTSRVQSARGTLMVTPHGGLTPELNAAIKKGTKDLKPAFVYIATESDTDALREITVDVFGDDLETLNSLTRGMAKKLEKVEGLSDIVLRYKSPRPEIQIVVDKNKAERVGISTKEIGEALRYAIQGGVATKYLGNNREMDVRIRYQKKFRNSTQNINEIYLKSSEKIFVPLKEIARIVESQIPVKIYRKNKKRFFSFSFRPEQPDVNHITEVLDGLKKIKLPEGYRINFGKELRAYIEKKSRIYYVLATAVLLIFMILSSHFESFKKPFIVIMPVPIILIWVIFVFRVLRISITIPVIVSFMMLASLVVLQSVHLIRRQKIMNLLSDPGFSLDLRSQILPFLIPAVCLIGFFLPFLLTTGDGRNLIASSIGVMVVGMVFSPLLVPPVLYFFNVLSRTKQPSLAKTLIELIKSIIKRFRK